MRLRVLLSLLSVLVACPPPPSGDDDDDEDIEEEEPTGVASFSYIPLGDTRCANDTAAGYGLAELAGARTLVVFLNGGGACWDDFTCFGLNAAAHIATTYSAEVLDADVVPLTQTGLTDRDDVDSPFRRATFAFVPYCTADLHAGDGDKSYQVDLVGNRRTLQHRGRRNVVAIAADLAGRFPAVEEVLVMGASAGGYGAILNADVFAFAFPRARLHFFIDGAPFVPPLNGQYGLWQSAWTMALPEACADCATDFRAVIGHVHAALPDSRFALLTTTGDETIRTYFGYGLDEARMITEVNALVDAHYDAAGRHAFVTTGIQHVLIGGYRTLEVNGRALRPFVDGWATGDDDTFQTTRP